MSDINLLQNSSTQVQQKTGFSRTLNIIGILVLVAFVVLSVVLYLLVNTVQKQIDTVKVQQAEEQTKIEQVKGYSKLIATQKSTLDLKTLLTDRLEWQNTLPNLAKATLNTVYYSSVTLNNDGAGTVVGNANSYKDLYRYITALSTPPYSSYIKNITIVGAGLSDNGKIVFTLSMQFAKEFWAADPVAALAADKNNSTSQK